MKPYFKYFVVLFLFVFGCSTQKVAQPSERLGSPDTSSLSVVKDTLSKAEIETATFDSSFLFDSNYDAFLSHYIEAARKHYNNAISARKSGDTLACGKEFEHAIADLNEISNFPGIDSSQEFTDLSHRVLGDYEKYIASIDSLGPESSIFALREKLDQMSDSTSTAENDSTQRIITTTSIPLVINGYVEQNLQFFTTRFRGHFEQWLERSGKYFPRMRAIFKEEGVPDEMIYLCMIESGINPVAQSWKKAVGMWQFMKGTGTLYGLQSNFWYDERCDYEKSARAAAKLLKALYSDYGDWYLVLAAYNSGGGRVNRAIRKSKSHDFWKMRPFLPKQTRNYVPEYIAATVIAMDPKSYGFNVTPADPLDYDVVTVNDCVDLSVLAECAETDVTTIHELNPAVLRWCTPPGSKDFTLRVPLGKADMFSTKYAAVPDEKKHNQITHVVKKRETLSSIANRYGITSKLLAEANHLRPKSKVSKGTVLMIPVPAGSKIFDPDIERVQASKRSVTARKTKQGHEAVSDKVKTTYRIKKGDTLGKIAQRYGIRASELRDWNDLEYSTQIKAGENLTVWVSTDNGKSVSSGKNADSANSNMNQNITEAKPAQIKPVSTEKLMSIQVRSGDNLRKIAKRYGVTVANLKKWNSIDGDLLREGEKLVIRKSVKDKEAGKSIAAVKKDTTGSSVLKSYTVKKGDTLFAIAALFGVSIDDLRTWNRIRGNHLKIGQEIKINS